MVLGIEKQSLEVDYWAGVFILVYQVGHMVWWGVLHRHVSL